MSSRDSHPVAREATKTVEEVNREPERLLKAS